MTEKDTSRYQAIREKYAERTKSLIEYKMANVVLAQHIVCGFKDYLGMPDHFDILEGERRVLKHYATFYRIEDDDTLSDPLQPIEAIRHHEDGGCSFGFGLALEGTSEASDRMFLQFRVDCQRRAESVTITIAGESVDCSFDGRNCPDIEKVHILILNLIEDWLAFRPGEHNAKPKIGFQMF